jgi:RHS repeat-associated protein
MKDQGSWTISSASTGTGPNAVKKQKNILERKDTIPMAKHTRHIGNSLQTILLATSQSKSVLAEVNRGEVSQMTYSVYGHLSGIHLPSTHLGFNGECRQRHTGWYMLGNGYRAYNPVLMRFHSPDKLSPFGAGGLNPYTYCAADPINHRDPSGRIALPVILSQLAGVGGGVSSLGGMALSLSTSARFSGQGVLALGTGATGVLLGAAAVANPASVIAPVLASAGITAGVASMTLAYRAARAATARGTQWFQSAARFFNDPPLYSTLSLRETPPPSFSSLDLSTPPPYTPPRAQNPIAPIHSTTRSSAQPSGRPLQNTRSSGNQKALLSPTERVIVQMGELPRVHFIGETKSAAEKVRATVR